MNCLDTYALMEIYNGNTNFADLLKYDFVITNITMAEFYGILYKEYNTPIANHWLEKLKQYCVNVELNILIKATHFWKDSKKENISFFDAVGYTYALEKNYAFVTGDKEFKNRKNVSYIK